MICEDFDGNKFGGYINATLDKIHDSVTHDSAEDPESFLFSLKSNGRLKGMMKFESKDEDSAKISFYEPK